MIEIYLNQRSVVGGQVEEKTFQRFDAFRDCFDPYWEEVVDSSFFGDGCRMYEEAEQEYLLDADEGEFAGAVARVEHKRRDPEEGLYKIIDGGFVEFIARVTRRILLLARKLAAFGVSMPRQRLITEFFRPDEAN
jgi:hypothetical protein